MPAAVEADAVVWGKRRQDVLVQRGRVRSGEAAGAALARRDVGVAVSRDLCVGLAVRGGVIAGDEDLA
jgi:hypothetical protein